MKLPAHAAGLQVRSGQVHRPDSFQRENPYQGAFKEAYKFWMETSTRIIDCQLKDCKEERFLRTMASGGIHPSCRGIGTRSDRLPQPRLFGNISQTRQKMKRPTLRRPLVCVLFLEQPPSSLHQKPALAKEPTHRRLTPFFALFSLVWILFKILAGFQIRFVSFLDKYIAWKSDKSNA